MARHDHEIHISTRKPLAIIGAILGAVAGACIGQHTTDDKGMLAFFILPLFGIAAPYFSKGIGFCVILVYLAIIANAVGILR